MEGGDGDLNKKSKEVTVESLEAQPFVAGGGKEIGKKKKVVVKKKLKQELIDLILKEPFEPLREDNDEEEVAAGMSEAYRACNAKTRLPLRRWWSSTRTSSSSTEPRATPMSTCSSPTTAMTGVASVDIPDEFLMDCPV